MLGLKAWIKSLDL